MDFLKNLNQKQLEAVTAPLGPVLVLAGAGSGKTRALTYRIAYLIKTKTFAPQNILAVTFTNKAAAEMKERVGEILTNDPLTSLGTFGHDEQNIEVRPQLKGGLTSWPTSPSTSSGPSAFTPTVGTFHSICARLLRREIHHLKPFTSGFTIFDSDDSLRALKQIVKTQGLELEITPNAARGLISSIKNQQLSLESLEKEQIAGLFRSYQALLREVNALDFDDLLQFTVELFEKHPRVLYKYQSLWPYVLVDEYQDTNNVQYKLIKLLVGEAENIFAVGDDAQSIYGFRGANFKNILNFERDFPKAKVVTLDENYRSTQNILNAANSVIKLSSDQKEKNLWTKNREAGRIIQHTAIDETAEAMFVAGEIIKYATEGISDEPVYIPEADSFDFQDDVYESQTPFFDRMLKTAARPPSLSYDGGRPPSFPPHEGGLKGGRPLDYNKLKDIVVLYRTNAQSRALEEAMLQYGIPYHLVGSVRFYERKEIKDLLCFLRLILNNKDVISLSRIINVPPRSIGEKSLELILQNREGLLTTRAKNAWENFVNKLQSIRNTPSSSQEVGSTSTSPPHEEGLGEVKNVALTDIINLIVKKFNLEEYYRDGSSEGEDRWENVKELSTVAGRFANQPWQEGLKLFLEEITLYSEADEVGSISGVTLMTLHQAKGLEFDTVFMVGLEEGLLPHMKALEAGQDISEEIRLAYVGITRARKNLYLINTRTRRIFGGTYTLKPSRVLRAVPEELLEVRGGWD